MMSEFRYYFLGTESSSLPNNSLFSFLLCNVNCRLLILRSLVIMYTSHRLQPICALGGTPELAELEAFNAVR